MCLASSDGWLVAQICNLLYRRLAVCGASANSNALWLSDVLPLTYAVDGMRNIMIKGADLSWSTLQLDLGVVVAFCLVVIGAGTATLRRRIA